MKIFATEERQRILDDAGIRYSVDQELNFYFPTISMEEKAIKVLKGAFAL